MNHILRRLAVAVSLWTGGLLPGPAAAQPAPLRPVSVVVFPGGFNWPIWVAEEQGFFRGNGIAVTVTPTPSSVFQLTKLIDGTFDIAETAIDNIIAYDEGQGEVKVDGTPDLVAFLGGDDGFLRLVAVPGVSSYDQLKGREISVDALTTGYAFVLREMLERGGLAPDDVRLVRAGGVLERFNDLLAEKHAATLLLSPFEVLAEARGFHLLGSAVDLLGHYQGIVAATRRSWASEHKPELAAYSRAYRQGLDWLFDPANKAQAIALLRRNIPTMSEQLADRSYQILVDPAHGFTRDASIDMAGVRTVLQLRSKYSQPARVLDDPARYLDVVR